MAKDNKEQQTMTEVPAYSKEDKIKELQLRMVSSRTEIERLKDTRAEADAAIRQTQKNINVIKDELIALMMK